MMKIDPSGVYRTAGSTRASRYDFSVKIAEIFHLDKALVEPVGMSDLKVWVAKRPKDSLISVNKVRKELKVSPSNFDEALNRMKLEEELKFSELD